MAQNGQGSAPGGAAMAALMQAGRRLLEVDPDSFDRLLAAARAFVAAHDEPDEPEDTFTGRLDQISFRSPRE